MSTVKMKASNHDEWLEFDFGLGRDGMFTWEDGALAVHGRIVTSKEGEGWLDIEGRIVQFAAVRVKNRVHVWAGGQTCWIETAAPGKAARPQGPAGDDIVAPMPGTVLRIAVAEGDVVEAQQPVVVLESMKMELTLSAPRAGKIERILCKEGDLIDMNVVLARLAKPARP